MKTAYHSILRDILLLVPRLLVASFRVLGEQVLSGAARRLRKLSSVPWLAAQLQLDPGLIKAARVEAVHTGTATRSRLLIDYADSAAAEGRPGSLFIKSRPPAFGSALFGVLFGLGGNEVRFYREIRRDVPV